MKKKTKAEEAAFKAYPKDMYADPVEWGVVYPPRMLDGNEKNRKLFLEGYRRGEKDYRLTFEDVEWITEQLKTMGGLWVKTNPACEEVLKKFVKRKEEQK